MSGCQGLPDLNQIKTDFEIDSATRGFMMKQLKEFYTEVFKPGVRKIINYIANFILKENVIPVYLSARAYWSSGKSRFYLKNWLQWMGGALIVPIVKADN